MGGPARRGHGTRRHGPAASLCSTHLTSFGWDEGEAAESTRCHSGSQPYTSPASEARIADGIRRNAGPFAIVAFDYLTCQRYFLQLTQFVFSICFIRRLKLFAITRTNETIERLESLDCYQRFFITYYYSLAAHLHDCYLPAVVIIRGCPATFNASPPHQNLQPSEPRFPPPHHHDTTFAMAAFQMHNFYRPSSLTVDTHTQNYFEDEEGSILDENILDQNALDSGLEMSPPMNGSRRDSFAVSSALFSPKTDEWQQVDMQQQQPMGSNNPFVEQNNNPFMRGVESQSSYGHQSHGWSMGNGSGMSTPMQGHDGLPSEFEVPVFQRPMQTPFTNPGNQQLPVFSSGNTSNGSIPTSPQKEWSVSDAMEHRSMPKRMRPHSPTLRSHPDMSRRGDGIRKKNARFDIPAERNLNNIDQLIAQSNDEQEIKELKQQKRLLRNRQAA